jgi:hypothetical protein
MKKLISFIILVSIMFCSAVARSQSIEKVEPGFVLLDVLLYRPLGLAATIIGAGVYIGTSPLTALASIPKPHDAFTKVGNILIGMPAEYTFIRPIGNREFPYHASRYKQKPVAVNKNVDTYNMTVKPEQRPVPPALPYEQPPQSYPYTGNGL